MVKYFIGPMSKNIVDSILDFQSETGEVIGFIPSRRQVEFDGGYVNRWTTERFREYVGNSFVTRDHGGPGQGFVEDDGFASLAEDCKYLDMIHIDPWKKHSGFEDGLRWTVNMIKYCHARNENLLFEVATEESIRRFEVAEIYALLGALEQRLTPSEFSRVEYCVIQSGTSLKGNANTGEYDKQRLVDMVEAVQGFNLKTKEHNGDYLPIELMKEELINICGHYVLSDQKFLINIKNNFENVDELIKQNIKNKLKELVHG